MDKRQNMISGLREMAQFFEDHPEVDITSWDGNDRTMSIYDRLGKDDVVVIAKAFGSCDKSYESNFCLTKTFGGKGGPILQACFDRKTVCERVVTGTKVIPATVLPAREETVIPEQVVEEFEWNCRPILDVTA